MGWSITPNTASIDENGVANFPNTPNVTYTVTYTDDKGCSASVQYTVTGSSCDCSKLTVARGGYSETVPSTAGNQLVGYYTVSSDCTITDKIIIAYDGDYPNRMISTWCTASTGNIPNTINLTYNENTSTLPRTTYVTVRGNINGNYCDPERRIMVTQEGVEPVTCNVSIPYPTVFFDSSASTENVGTITGCSISKLSGPDWVTVSQSNDIIYLTVEENTITSERSGTVELTVNGSTSCNSINVTQAAKTVQHDYVEIGGIKWATMNIGARSITDYGQYFSWANVEGCSNSCSFTEYKYSTSKGNRLTGDITDEAIGYDAATENWGDDWRMPTKEEFATLVSATNYMWKENYLDSGVNGMLMQSIDNPSIELFFPAGGDYDGSTHQYVGENGYYWTRNYNNAYRAYSLNVYDGTINAENLASRYLGMLIRPIKIN